MNTTTGFLPAPDDYDPENNDNAELGPNGSLGDSNPEDVRPDDSRADWMHNLLPQPQDADGNSLAISRTYDTPAVDDVPLEQTPWARLVYLVEKCNAAAAYDLHAFFERKLRPSIHRLLDVRRREEEVAAQRHAAAREHNSRLEEKVEKLKAQCKAVTQKYQAKLQALEEFLAKAHREAAHRVALAGGFYDPKAPDPACVLRHARQSLQALAAELGLPWTPDDEAARMPKTLATALTIGIGMLLGISLGIMSRFFMPDLLQRFWPVVLFFAGVGVLIAYAGGESVKLFFKSVGERYWLGRPPSNWGPILAAALLFSATLIGIDSYVQQQGLMALVKLEDDLRALSRNATPTGASSALYFLAGMILTLPYIGVNAWHGYLLGRHRACLNRLIAERDRRYAATDTAIRQDIEVQHALAAISVVHKALSDRKADEERLSATQAQFDAEIARLEAQRLDEMTGLDEAAKLRVQDAEVNYRGAQQEWNQLLESAKKYWVLSPGSDSSSNSPNPGSLRLPPPEDA